MDKAVISDKIYISNPTSIELDSIISSLTYKIPKAFNPNLSLSQFRRFTPFEIIKNYKIISDNIIAIPQTRTDLLSEDVDIIDKRINLPIEYPKPLYPLYDNQLEVYNKVDGNCIINASPGWGKTFTALHIANKLKQKTLVIVHTLFLRDQWVKSIEKLYGTKCGLISSGEFNTDSYITISNIQSLRKHLPKVTKSFGLVTVDECLDYNSRIQTLEYGIKTIGSIVNQKLNCHVLSYNEESGINEYKKVLNYFKNKDTSKCLYIYHDAGGSFKCTKNHSVYVWKDGNIYKKPAEDLKPGEYLIQHKLGHKSNNIFNKEWHPIILGIILGDGCLRLDNKMSNSCRVSITHGEDQKDYLDWKASILGNTCMRKGKSGYNKDREIYSITTKSFIDIYGWKSALYLNSEGNKCTVPASISSILTKESWAIMYQDDGSAEDNQCTFSFCELDEASIRNLVDSLIRLFNITEPKTYTCSRGFNYIRLKLKDSIKFKEGIKNLVHPTMLYKLKGIDTRDYKFNFPIPSIPLFNQDYCVRKIISITPSTLTRGYRFNIEVEDNHNYFANGILVANCHHISAPIFTETLTAFHSKYKIGLSGTLQRKDGKHILFRDSFGDNIIKSRGNVMTPSIKLLNTKFSTNGNSGWSDRLTELLGNDEYKQFIANLAKAHMQMGHCVLVLADRVEFIEAIQTLVGDKCVAVTGKTKDRDTIVEDTLSGKFDCISASTKIFSEGISVDKLSAVILANPINNDALLEQIIGRIQRFYDNKLEPLVVDIQLAGYADAKQNNSRRGFYMRKGWHTEELEI